MAKTIAAVEAGRTVMVDVWVEPRYADPTKFGADRTVKLSVETGIRTRRQPESISPIMPYLHGERIDSDSDPSATSRLAIRSSSNSLV